MNDTAYRSGEAPSWAYLGTGRNRSYWLPLAQRDAGSFRGTEAR